MRFYKIVGIGMLFATRVVLLFILGSAQDAFAQAIPPHVPGTICFTPAFWCYSQPPGPPGTPCFCPGPRGPVAGTRG
jgi:hypothetical protein